LRAEGNEALAALALSRGGVCGEEWAINHAVRREEAEEGVGLLYRHSRAYNLVNSQR